MLGEWWKGRPGMGPLPGTVLWDDGLSGCSAVGYGSASRSSVWLGRMVPSGEVSVGQLWHSLRADEAIAGLRSSPSGLSEEKAADRLSRHGPNQLVGAPPVSPFKLLVDEFRSPLVVVLLAAALVLVGVSVLGDDSDQLVDAASSV